MDFPAIRIKNVVADSASQVNPAKQSVQSLVGDFFAARTALHKFHLKVTGIGSFAAHKTLGHAYEAMEEAADVLAEQWQGSNKELLEIPDSPIRQINSVEEAVDFLQEVKAKITMTQTVISESEIVNLLDEYKSKLNEFVYKLNFLK